MLFASGMRDKEIVKGKGKWERGETKRDRQREWRGGVVMLGGTREPNEKCYEMKLHHKAGINIRENIWED